jgi:anti-sigma regulatory factor (Ser/Thr protein kinase)
VRELPRKDKAPQLTRRWLAECLASHLDGCELADAKLLADELVTNALVHGRGRIELRAQLDEDRLLVEVLDQGQGFERIVRERDYDHAGGWGLNLVDALASRWGIHEGTSHVWFELERRRPRLGHALAAADLIEPT